MDDIIRRVISAASTTSLSNIIYVINSGINKKVKQIMSRNKIHGKFDITVRNRLEYPGQNGFSHAVTVVVKTPTCEHEYLCNYKEPIREDNPLYLLKGILISQVIKLNTPVEDGSIESIKYDVAKFIKEYLSSAMPHTKPIVTISRNTAGKYVIEVELIEQFHGKNDMFMASSFAMS